MSKKKKEKRKKSHHLLPRGELNENSIRKNRQAQNHQVVLCMKNKPCLMWRTKTFPAAVHSPWLTYTPTRAHTCTFTHTADDAWKEGKTANRYSNVALRKLYFHLKLFLTGGFLKLTSILYDKFSLYLYIAFLSLYLLLLPFLVMIMRSSGLADETALWKLSSLLIGRRSPWMSAYPRSTSIPGMWWIVWMRR